MLDQAAKPTSDHEKLVERATDDFAEHKRVLHLTFAALAGPQATIEKLEVQVHPSRGRQATIHLR